MVPQKAQRHGFAEFYRSVTVTAPMDATVHTVSEADVVRELVQLSIQGLALLFGW